MIASYSGSSRSTDAEHSGAPHSHANTQWRSGGFSPAANDANSSFTDRIRLCFSAIGTLGVHNVTKTGVQSSAVDPLRRRCAAVRASRQGTRFPQPPRLDCQLARPLALLSRPPPDLCAPFLLKLRRALATCVEQLMRTAHLSSRHTRRPPGGNLARAAVGRAVSEMMGHSRQPLGRAASVAPFSCPGRPARHCTPRRGGRRALPGAVRQTPWHDSPQG